LYVGKADNNLRKNISDLIAHGQGVENCHHDGELIWQLEGWHGYLICFKAIDDGNVVSALGTISQIFEDNYPGLELEIGCCSETSHSANVMPDIESCPEVSDNPKTESEIDAWPSVLSRAKSHSLSDVADAAFDTAREYESLGLPEVVEDIKLRLNTMVDDEITNFSSFEASGKNILEYLGDLQTTIARLHLPPNENVEHQILIEAAFYNAMKPDEQYGSLSVPGVVYTAVCEALKEFLKANMLHMIDWGSNTANVLWSMPYIENYLEQEGIGGKYARPVIDSVLERLDLGATLSGMDTKVTEQPQPSTNTTPDKDAEAEELMNRFFKC
jgi:hypothetical protein